jgi:hypothetical protein
LNILMVFNWHNIWRKELRAYTASLN